MFMTRRVKALSSLSKDCLQLPKLSVSQRHYVQATQVPVTECLDDSLVNRGTPKEPELKVTKLDNGVQIISINSDGGVSKVSVYIKAGSRYEDPSNLGITHFLRNSAFLTNKSKSSLRATRELQQHGISLGNPMLEIIASSVHGPLFQSWEIKNADDLCAIDRSNLEAYLQLGVLDKLHGAAFRSGLGNSIYCKEHRSYSGEQMSEFIKNNFVGERMSVVAIGCEHEALVKDVSVTLGSIPRGTVVSEGKQKYFGGEIRMDNESKLNHVALAVEGPSHVSKDLCTYGVLQHMIGSGSFIKYGSNTVSSRLNKAAASVSESPFMASSLNICHSDKGLFGFYTITDPKDTTQVVRAAVNEIKAVAKGKITDEEMARAKNQMKAAALMANENKDAMLEDVANQMLSRGVYQSPTEICSGVDAVTKADLSKVTQELLATKASFVVAGNLAHAPYYDELA
eukprot:gene8919-16544_t